DRAVHVAAFHVGARDLDGDVELRALGLVGLEPREAGIEFLEHPRRRVLLEAGDEVQAARCRIHLPVCGERVNADQKTTWDDKAKPHVCLHAAGSIRSSTSLRLTK